MPWRLATRPLGGGGGMVTVVRRYRAPAASPRARPTKLPGDDGGTVGIADIDALIRERNIGPATIEWLRQLHASGECDYLAALRLRSSRQ